MGIQEKLKNAKESTWFIDNVSEEIRKQNHDLVLVSSAIVHKRKELGLNQAEFARKMGVSQGMVSKWESGEYNFTLNTLNEICSKLDLIFTPRIDRKKYYFQEFAPKKIKKIKKTKDSTKYNFEVLEGIA